MCTPDMVWRPKQEISHEKRCLLDSTIDGNVPALPPLGPEHPRIFNNPAPVYTPRYTTQRPTGYTQTPPPRPTRPTYVAQRAPTYTPTYKPSYGVRRGRALEPEEWLKAKEDEEILGHIF